MLGVGLAAPGCGGEDPEPPDVPPAELLQRAVADPAASAVASIDLDARLEGESLLAGEAAATVEGPYELAPDGGVPELELELDGEVAGFGIDGELISTGDDAFVVFFGEGFRVGTERVAALE